MAQGQSLAVEDIGEAANLVLRVREQRLERGHERFHLRIQFQQPIFLTNVP